MSASLRDTFSSITFDFASRSERPRALVTHALVLQVHRPQDAYSRCPRQRRDAIIAECASPMHKDSMVSFTASMSENLPAVSTSMAWPDVELPQRGVGAQGVANLALKVEQRPRKTVTEVSVWSSAFSLSTQEATLTVLPHAMMSVGTRVVWRPRRHWDVTINTFVPP